MNQTTKKILWVFMGILFLTGTFLSAQTVLQTQESDLWEGINVDLKKVTVKNNVVTVKLKFRNDGSQKHSVVFKYSDCYIMDETNQKKYYVLKDADNIYIAGPQYDKDSGGRFWYNVNPQKAKSVWLKFPEPTDSPDTISISIPGVPPFDEVELKK